MYKILLFSFCSLFAFSTIACHHNHEDEDDSTIPVITIEEPVDGESIAGEVHFHGTVTDNSLHEMTIKVTRDSDGAEQFSAAPTVHDLTAYDFDEHWTPSGLTEETAVTVTITAEDHGSNKATKVVKFKVKP